MKLKYPKTILSILLVGLSFNLFADINWDWRAIPLDGTPLEGRSPSLTTVGGLTDKGGQPVVLLYRDRPSYSSGNIWAATSTVYGNNIYHWRKELNPLFKDSGDNPSVVSLEDVDQHGDQQIVATYEQLGSSSSNQSKIMAGIGTIVQGDVLVWSKFSLAGEGMFYGAGSSMAAIGKNRDGNQEVLIVYQKQNDTLQAKIGTVDKANNAISWRDADNFWDGNHYIKGNYPSVAYLGKDDSGNRLVLIVHNDYGSNDSKARQRIWAEIGTIDKYTGNLDIRYSENFFDNNTSRSTLITLLGKDNEGNQRVSVGNKLGTIDVKAPRLHKYAQIRWQDFNGTYASNVPAGYDDAGNPILFGVTTGLNSGITNDTKLYFGIGKITNE